MAWGKKNSAAPPPIPANPERSPDEIISEMLSAYHEHFYTQQKGNSRLGIDEAKAKVDRARRMIDESRVGYSLCSIADHTKPWHAWALRADFQQHAGFPATNVSGHQERLDEMGFATRTTTQFTYRNCPYTLVWTDEGTPLSAMDDYNGYGKINLYEAGRQVVGIEVSCDRTRGVEYERWHFTNVLAFDPGDWMKHVVEIAAHIDASRTRYRNSFIEDDVINRASKINL